MADYEQWKALGRPGGSFEAWSAMQGGVTPAEVAQAPTAQTAVNPGALTIGGLQQRAAQSGASEDWTRFQQGDVDRWSPFFDAASGRFRSSRGAPGLYDKPTECPPGMGPSGPNETDPCTTKGYGGTTDAAALAPAGDMAQPGQVDLAQMLSGLMPAGPYNGVQASAQPPTGAQLAQAMTPLQSSTQGLLQPQASPGMAPQASLGGMMSGLNNGAMQSQQVGGLTDMMRRRQSKQGQAGSWF